MDVEESVLLPVNAAVISAVICKYTQSGSIPVTGDNVCDPLKLSFLCSRLTD